MATEDGARAPDTKLSHVAKLQVWEHSLSLWLGGPHGLTAADCLVAQRLFHLCGWAGGEGAFSRRQIREGLPKHGIEPFPIDDRTIGRSIAKLRQVGIITVSEGGADDYRKNRFRVNIHWTPEGNVVALPIPKRFKVVGNSPEPAAEDGGQSAPQVGAIRPPQGGQDDLHNLSSIALPPTVASGGVRMPEVRIRTRKAPAGETPKLQDGQSQGEMFASVKEAVAAGAEKNAKAIQKQTERKENRATKMAAVWKKAWLETYAQDGDGETRCKIVFTPWSTSKWKDRKRVVVGEYDMMATFIKYFPMPEELSEFIDFVVRNWRLVILRRLPRLKVVPDFPKVRFLLHFKAEFLDAWAEKQTIAWINSLEGDKQEIERLRAKGASLEEAAMEVAKRRAKAEDREARAKAVEQAKLYYRMGDLARAEIARRPAAHPDNWMNSPPPKVTPTDDFEKGVTPTFQPLKPFEE